MEKEKKTAVDRIRQEIKTLDILKSKPIPGFRFQNFQKSRRCVVERDFEVCDEIMLRADAAAGFTPYNAPTWTIYSVWREKDVFSIVSENGVFSVADQAYLKQNFVLAVRDYS